jgi:hypothetical protein
MVVGLVLGLAPATKAIAHKVDTIEFPSIGGYRGLKIT